MSFRHKRSSVPYERRWQQFVVSNATTTQAIGLPPEIVADEQLWRDVLWYGWAEGAGPTSVEDPITTAFAVSKLGQAEYENLTLLATRYFEAGFAYIEPRALREEDRSRLHDVFDPDKESHEPF